MHLEAFTRKQFGHVSVEQAATVAVSPQDLYRLRKRGLLVHVHRSVYRAASVAPSREGDLMAAVLAGGPDAVAGYSSAIRLHGITRVPLAPQPEIVVPGRVAPVIPGVTVHCTRELEACDRTTVSGIPATSPARTNIDLADDRLDQAETMALTDDLICRKGTTRAWMHRRARHLANGRKGAGVIARLTASEAEAEFWSWLERRFDTAVVQAFNLPPPAYNVAVHDAKGRIGIADALWSFDRDVVAELDGLRFHQLTADRRRDSRKANRYAASNRIPLRFTYLDVVKHPAVVAEEIRAALRTAGASTPRGVGAR